MSIELQPDHEDDRRQDRLRQVLERLRQEEQDDRDVAAVVSCATCVRPFASSTISVFVGLPLTTNVPRQAGREVRRAEPDQVVVLDERLVVADRVGARGRGALGEDHEDHRDGGREQG